MVDSRLRAIAKQQAALCNVFANPGRLLIFWLLIDGERSVGEIADHIGLSMPAISQHLRLMKQMDVVVTRRDGQTIYYRIAHNGKRHGCPFLNDAWQQHQPLPTAAQAASPNDNSAIYQYYGETFDDNSNH